MGNRDCLDFVVHTYPHSSNRTNEDVEWLLVKPPVPQTEEERLIKMWGMVLSRMNKENQKSLFNFLLRKAREELGPNASKMYFYEGGRIPCKIFSDQQKVADELIVDLDTLKTTVSFDTYRVLRCIDEYGQGNGFYSPRGATYRQIAKAGNIVGLTKEEKKSLYKICEFYGLSAGHLSAIIHRLIQENGDQWQEEQDKKRAEELKNMTFADEDLVW